MKLLSLILVFLPLIAQADSLGMNLGFGQGTRPFYGVDYQFNINHKLGEGTPYLDGSLYTNPDYLQPGLSTGLQFTNINFGIASALANRLLSVGPELGWTSDTSFLNTYFKINNSVMGAPGRKFFYNITFSVGVNF